MLRKEYPCTVQIAIPPTGFRFRLILIELWLSDYLENGDYARWSLRNEMLVYAVWGFRDSISAKAFQANADLIHKLSDRQVMNRLIKRGY